jgi:hypothetical protein
VKELTAHFDGRLIVPDEPTGLAPGTRLRVTLEPLDEPGAAASGKLDLPLLTGVTPELVHSVLQQPEFDLQNAKMEPFVQSEA